MAQARAEGQRANETEQAYQARLLETRQALIDQRRAFQQRQVDVQRAAEAVRAALPLERELAKAFDASAAALGRAEKAAGSQGASLQRLRSDAEAAGRDLTDLAVAEDRVRAETESLARQAEELRRALVLEAAGAEEGAAAMRALERASSAADKALVDSTQAILQQEQAAREAAREAERLALANFDAAESSDDWAAAAKRAEGTLRSELAALKDSEEFTRRYEQSLREAAAAAQKLADAEDAESMRRLERAASDAEAEFRQLTQSLKQTESAAEAYARATALAAGAGSDDVAATRARIQAAEALIESERGLTTVQRDLSRERDRGREALVEEAQALLAATRAAEANREATARLVTQARTAADTLERAFGQTGVRSLQAIEAEIAQVDAAMAFLERRLRAGAVSQDDFARAASSAQVRLQTLKREMATVPRIDGVFERANSALTGLLSRFGALSAAVATVGIAVRPVIDATVALEQMRRVLTTVSGSADVAQEQIEFLRGTAQRAGQQFTVLGESYAKFAASALQSGVSLEQTQQVFQSVALAAGNLGLSSDQAKRALEALSQIASKGVVNMEELRQQLGDALPGILPALARELGLTQAELVKLVESGQLLAAEAIPAIGRSLRNLQPANGVVNGMVAEWNRFINVIKQAGTAVVEGPLGAAAGAVLKALAFTIGGLGGAAVSASEALRFLGLTINATSDLLQGDLSFEQYRKSLADFASEARDNVFQYVNTMRGAGDATQAFGQKVEKLGGSLARVAIDQQKQIDAAEDATRGYEKLAQAAEVMLRSVESTQAPLADEAEALDLVRDATEQVAQARNRVAEAADREVAAAKQARAAYVEAAAAQGLSNDAIKAGLEELDKKIAKAEVDAEKTRAQAQAARQAADAAELAATKFGDQSRSLDSLREATSLAQRMYDSTVEAFKAGIATTDDVRQATDALRKSKNLLRDAVDDLAQALERELGVLRSENAVKEASLKLDLEQAKLAGLAAKARGDETSARQALVRQKEIELSLTRLGNNLKLDEIKTQLDSLDVEEKALQSTGQLTAERRTEIETRRRNLVAQTLETQARVESTKVQAEEVRSLKTGTESRYGHTKALDDSTTSAAGNTGAVERNTAAVRENERAVEGATRARQEWEKSLRADPSRLVGGEGIAGITSPGLTGVRSPDSGNAGDIGPGIGSDFGSGRLYPDGSSIRVAGGFQLATPAGSGWTFVPDQRVTGGVSIADAMAGRYPTSPTTTRIDVAGVGYWKRAQGEANSGRDTTPGNNGPFGGYAGSSQQRADQAVSKVVRVDISVNGKTVQVPTTESAAEQLLSELERAKGTGA